MAHRSQCSSVGENPMDPNYLPLHYREEYRLAIDALVENDLDGYYNFLQNANVVDFLSRTEIEHIKNNLHLPQSVGSLPELPYQEVNDEGSSDTYWPLHSDLDAPGLDLGWPLQQHCFIGPTEVTTLVNPSDPEMPSMKEQARRLIKNAQQVIAVVMDMFTDVDIFNDLLQAAERHVPVYIILDEQNSHHFTAMVTSCKVNLDMIHMMRVRTVSGITYFCRTGKSFKGQVMDRFLLVDCRAVLSGNYSFMWSFEKIHRCIAHLFSGELVASFDEEFRILFAQSQPLVIENALVPVPSDGSSGYISNQFGLKRTQSLRNPQGFRRQTELMAYPFGDRHEPVMPFKREDTFRHTIEPGGALHGNKFATQQFRMQQSFLEPSRPLIASRQLDMNSYKRHSYAEGTRESYSSSRQYMKQRVMNNLDEMDAHFQRDQQFYHSEGMGPDTGHGRYDSLRGSVPHQLDRYSDHMYQPEIEAPVSQNLLSSDDLGHDLEGKHHQSGGHFAQPGQKRPTVGQAYACQNSPTQIHPQDQKQMFSSGEQGKSTQDPSVKQGLRSWRINSYLSTYENTDEEGLQIPLGPDTFDEPQQPEIRPRYSETSGLHYNTQEVTNTQSKPKIDFRPRYGKPILPDKDFEKIIGTEQASARKDSQMKSAIKALPLTSTEPEDEKEKDSNIPKDNSITKHESFRSKINPVLQRSSRLRSSLIFSSSKVEQHSSTTLLEDEDTKPIKKSSIVAEILEKRRSFSREPFDWNKHKMLDEKDKNVPAPEEVTYKPEDTKEVTSATDIKDIKEEPINLVPEKQDLPTEPKPTATSLTDPASRLQYFKELSQKRRESKSEEEFNRSKEPQPKTPDITDNPSIPATTLQSIPATTSVGIVITEPISTTAQADFATKPSVLVSNSQLSDSSGLADESTDAIKKDTVKEPPRPTKPLPSPKFFKRDVLKPFKSPHQRRISCGDDILTDATDAEKSEFKKSRSFSTSGMTRSESKESLNLSRQGSTMSLNVSEGKDSKPLDFLKKQTQKLKGILAPKGEKKNASASVTAEEKQMKTVPEVAEEPPPNVKETHADLMSNKNSKSTNKPSQSRYQSSTSNVLFSSNLRDDTKVILEQISANRQELTKQTDATGSAEGDKGGHVSNLDREPFQRYQTRNRFTRAPPNPQERDTLLKRIESMRKEKKVYSLFEIGNNLG